MMKKNDFIMVRTYSAGVFVGNLVKRKGREVTLNNVIRIWYWDGAASLSQLAVDGTSKPGNCKFAMPVKTILLLEVIEILTVTAKAKKSIIGVPSWKN